MNNNELHEAEFDPIFSYSTTRERHLGQGIPDAGSLMVSNLIRPQYLSEVRDSLLADAAIFSRQPNTRQQLQASAVSRQFLWELHSGIMLRLLENITGFTNLLPDTHCVRSGINGNTVSISEAPTPAGLHAAITLLIDLSTGDATIRHTVDVSTASTPSSPEFFATYWQYQGAVA